MRREVKVSTSYEFLFKFYTNGLQVVPASASAILLNSGGTEISSGACSIDVSSGDVTYTLSSSLNTELGENFRAEITYNEEGETKYYYELYTVVYTPLVSLCSDENLFAKLPELRNQSFDKVDRTTETGFINELRCLNLISDTREYEGGKLEIYISDTETHSARVTSYEKTSGSCIFSPAYTSAIGDNVTFKIRPSFQFIIDDAWEQEVQRDIRNRIGVASRFIDSNIVTNLICYKALELYCLSQIEEEGDKWSIRELKYRKRYMGEFTALSEAVDTSNDGQINDTENKEKSSTVNVGITR